MTKKISGAIFMKNLETERLILRPLTVEDYQACFKWCGDARVNEYMIYPLYKKAEDVKEWLKTLNTDEKHIDYGFVL
ncbi:MAG: GNAT family N-acetyltransferase, partial [Spirochaetaceae bacterium]|nr:GNAT family N-acetyltransferase [Spirochaetaceae bacterium]